MAVGRVVMPASWLVFLVFCCSRACCTRAATSVGERGGVRRGLRPPPLQTTRAQNALGVDQTGVWDDRANPDHPDDPIKFLASLWGTSKWPPDGKEQRPPVDDQGNVVDAVPADVRLSFMVLMITAVVLVAALCLFLSGLELMPGGGDGSPQSTFAMHMRALSSAIMWRHLHKQALCMHMVRIAVPCAFLVMMWRLRENVAKGMTEHASQYLSKDMQDRIVDGVVEYVLCLAILNLCMVSTMFFVSHLSAESESGLRHLLHVSGVSRPAYLIATIGSDGVLQSLLGALAVVLISGALLQVRMVLWTSPWLILGLTIVLVQAAVLVGCLVSYICSARVANMLIKLIFTVLLFVAPFAPLGSTVPELGKQSWLTLALPPLPAYRCLFELIEGCVRGRCMDVSDFADAFANGQWARPWQMVSGVKTPPQLDPAESLISHLGLVSLQLMLGWILVVLLDIRSNPPLHSSGVHASSSQTTLGPDVLSVSGLVHWYGWLQGRWMKPESRVLNVVSFSIQAGTMLGLLGPNGSGKTTTIRCIVGEESPQEGAIAINTGMVKGRRCAHIGLCPQETILNKDLTVRENLLFFAYVRGTRGADAETCVDHILSATRLEDKRDALPDALSGGMRRRLAVGCAMNATPPLTILDEPTTGLDPLSRRGVWSTINEIKAAGGCCLLTTHMLEEAEALCTRLVILKRGTLVAEGTVQQLKERWGTGYVLSIDSTEDHESKAHDYVLSLLPEKDRALIKKANGQMSFKLTCEDEQLGHLIISISRGKAVNGVKRWGLSQASLEDTYVRIIEQVD